MVARRWGCDRVPPICKQREQDSPEIRGRVKSISCAARGAWLTAGERQVHSFFHAPTASGIRVRKRMHRRRAVYLPLSCAWYNPIQRLRYTKVSVICIICTLLNTVSAGSTLGVSGQRKGKVKKYGANAPQLHPIWPQTATGAHSPVPLPPLHQRWRGG